MPSRNRIKIYDSNSYYHIYNRGVDKSNIFKDKHDYIVFLNLLKRYLDKEPSKDKWGRDYESLYDKLELLAFCLMPNHFHLLIYQNEPNDMTRLMHRVVTGYSAYFNRRYKRTGPLFQDRFKASLISRDEYLQHISRYIHLNPGDYKNWEFSSLEFYLKEKQAEWVRPDRILNMFEVGEYQKFISDYEAHKEALDVIKHELAN